jgi:hypothetical protein
MKEWVCLYCCPMKGKEDKLARVPRHRKVATGFRDKVILLNKYVFRSQDKLLSMLSSCQLVREGSRWN